MILLNIADFFHHLFQNPDDLFEPEKLIRYGGLFILFMVVFAQTGFIFFFFLPGDALIFAAGVFFASGTFQHPLHVILTALITAAVLGNMVGYWIGRKTGKLLMKKKESWFFKKQFVHSATDFYDRYKGWAIAGSLFFPVLRTFSPVIAGIIGMDIRKYFLYTAAGAAAWIGLFVSTGYFLGHIPWVRNNLHFISLFLTISFLTPVLVRAIREYRKAKQKKRSTQSPDTF